jgi:hypothetical protein
MSVLFRSALLAAACLVAAGAAASAAETSANNDLAGYSNYYDARPKSSVSTSRAAHRLNLDTEAADVQHANACGVGECGYGLGGHRWRDIVFGIEATYLRANPKDGHDPYFPDAFFAREFADMDDYAAAPRVWVGVESCAGRGIRARYWDYRNAAHAEDFDVEDIETGEGLFLFNACAGLRAYAIDLEVTRRRCTANGWVLGSLGVRHAALARNDSLNVFLADDDLLISTAATERFDATGLTAALEGWRPIGDSPFAWYGNVRGSVLWGDTHQTAWSVYQDPVSLAAQYVQTRQPARELYIFEFQTGLEWSRPIMCCDGRLFLRTLFEYQLWTQDRPGLELAQEIDGVQIASGFFGRRVEFYGLTFAAGMDW